MSEAVTSTSADISAGHKLVTESADGAIGIKRGTVVITKVSAAALTLALPTAGADDGSELVVIDDTGAAHTVTTPSNGINGNAHVATFAGTKGQQIKFTAYGGVWLASPSVTGITLS